MRKKLITIIILSATFVLPGIMHAQIQSPAIGFSEDTILIACEPDYPPYCMVDENGNPSGFSIDLFQATADATGLNLNIKIGIWEKIKHELANGELDALPLVGRTPEREEIFDFTMPYLSLHGAVFVREGTKGIDNLNDLKDKEIVVMKGDNAEEFVRRDSISDKIFTTPTYEQAFKELAQGKYDALITQRITGITLLEELNIESIQALDFYIPQFRQDFCFAVQKGDSATLARLNEGLSIIIANNTYDNLKEKWFGVDNDNSFDRKAFVKLLLYIMIPLSILLIASWIFMLRKEVKRRTWSLHNEIDKHKATLENLNRQKIFLNELEKTSKTGGWEFDKNTQTLIWTLGTYAIFGVSENDFKPGPDNALSFYRPKDQQILTEAFLKLMESGQSYSLVLQIKTATGEQKWIKTMGKAEYQHGEISKIYGNIADITEIKTKEIALTKLTNELEMKVEERTRELNEKVSYLDKSQTAMLYMVEDLNKRTEELKEERRKLEHSNQELKAFTYSVSHDLRAPLRAINGFAKFLHDDFADKLDDEGKRYIHTIRNNAAKMDQLISDLLNLSRVSRSRIELTETDMTAVAKAMYHEIATEEEKESFDISIADMPKAKTDINLIKQVWQNLISNALKYSSKSDTKVIEIYAEKTKDKILYSIKDHGAGFDPRYKHKLFGVFQRLHSEKEFEGTGVGLAIVKRIINRHRGEVNVESEINKGTVVSFTIPES
ncbi:MAG: transporter substrate-binding domain-containing protein [Bacteroidales bacterium]